MSQQIDSHIGRFPLQERLASTSLATLYRAKDPGNGQQIAVKALRPFFSEESDLLADYFEQIRRVAALHHPHIVSVLDTGEDGTPWVAMEFMGEGSLAKRLESPITIADVGKLLSQIGSALDAAHSVNVIHGDLKPSNVFISLSGDYKLSDFGMATLAKGAHPLIRSSSSTPMPTYMSPEQAMDMSVSKRSDVYALGVLAYHLLTGRVPHQGSDPTTVWAKQLRSPAPRPNDLNPLIPSLISDVILTAIASNPEKRYASPVAVAEAFGQAAAAAPTPVITPPVTSPSDPTPPSEQEPVLADVGLSAGIKGRRIYCRVCGHDNSASLAHCESCWATLWPADAVEEQAQDRQIVERRLQGRGVRAVGVGSAALAVLIGSVLFLTVGNASVPLPSQPGISAVSAEGQWAMSQRDATHSGFLPGLSPSLEGTVKWMFATPEIIWAAPAVTGDVVYLATGDRRILALRTDDGSTIWSTPLDSPVDGTPAVTDDTVFLALRSRKVMALDRLTGDIKWVYRTPSSVFTAPTVKDGVVYVGDLAGILSAIDAESGRLLWEYKTDDGINASIPISDNGVAVVASQDGNVYFVDIETGGTRYFYRTVIPAGAAPSVSGDTAFIGTENGTVLALDINERRRPFDHRLFTIRTQLFVWNVAIDRPPRQRGFVWINNLRRGSVVSTPVIADTSVFVATRRGMVYAIDKSNSLTQWSFRTGGSINHSAVLAGNILYVGSDDGTVYGLDSDTGDVVWSWDVPLGNLPSSSLVVADGSLYVPTSQERPRISLFQIGDDGSVLPEEPVVPDKDWYYKYSSSPCSPDSQDSVGPFSAREDARSAAIAAAPTCGVLYAIQ